ncbi:uncharacterized protein LOC141629226 [Silene latifolia]|uniref:uncharacterized protein LOC141629226 n=1 Tax=Silene latifolia TaxID=37657 RepID=UPI003D777F87
MEECDGCSECLRAGARRRIGDGKDTSVWGHAWVVGSNSGKVISSCGPGNELIMVAVLIEPHGRGWNVTMLNQLFLPFEVKRILNIRLSPNEPKDSWYWCLDREREYSVKMAYASIIGDLYESGGPSNWEKERWLWNRLWKVRVWPRIKLFFWQHRNSSARNKMIFDKEVLDPARIVQRTRDILAEIASGEIEGQVRVGRQGVHRREQENEGWRSAMGGYVKINVDAGVKEGEGVSSGVVCRDDRGVVMWGLTVVREEEWDPKFAEAMAVHDGLEEAKTRGIRQVVVERDCL